MHSCNVGHRTKARLAVIRASPFKAIVLARRLAPLVLGVLLLATPAFAAGNAEAGWQLARQWCSGCHTVDPTQHATDAAPSFRTIAREHGRDRGWIRAWLASPHPPMPNPNLSGPEIDDIIAYLGSLSGRQ